MYVFYKNTNSQNNKLRITISCFIIIYVIGLSTIYNLVDNLKDDIRLDLLWKNDKHIMKPILKTKDPHDNAVRLMNYLTDIYGKNILSGQQIGWDSGWNSYELDAIYKETGKYPAIVGLDFMEYSPSRVERAAFSVDTEKAIKWWKNGGIVTFCWHWNAPMNLIDQGPDQKWWSGMYTRATTFDFAKGLEDHNSIEYQLIIRDIDAIASQLKRLQEEGVPILWRPLHEASGGWFWWGSKGSEPYKKLWRLMFERLTEYHKLKNLIWVWNGQDKEWYPGDDVVDIIGEHNYLEKHDYSPLKEEFKKAKSYTNEDKMIALTENGPIPDPDILLEKGITWLWFCTWCETPIINKNKRNYSEEFTQTFMLKKVYNHDYVITRDELPDLKNYPIN